MKLKRYDMTHGGKRPNAGRPKGEPTTTIAFRVKLYHAEPIKQLVKEYLKQKEDERKD